MKPWIALLLLVPLLQAAPTGEQDSLSSENILALDVSGTRVLAAWEDDRSQFSANDPVNTWAIWENGVRIRTGATADADCGSFSTCVTTPLGVSLAGTRFIVASNDENLNAKGRLLMGTTTQGITDRLEFDDLIEAFAASEDGKKVGVVTSGFGSSTLRMYHWTGSNPGTLSLQWTKQLPEAADFMVIGNSGEGAIAAGDLQVRFTSQGTLRQYQADDNIISLDYGTGSRSLAGLADGRVLVFGADSNTAPYAPVLEFHPHDDAINAVAWVTKDSFLVGDAAGRLTHYWNTDEVTVTNEVRWQQQGAAVSLLQANEDHAFVARSDGLTFLNGTGAMVWEDDSVADLIAMHADYVVASIGDTLVPFAAIRGIDVDVPDFTVATGGSATEQLRITNTGNREITVDLSLQTGAGWTGTLADDVTVAPNQFVETPLTLTASSNVQAGDAVAALRITGAGISPLDLDINITVPGEVNWDLVADSAQTQGANPGETIVFDFHLLNRGNEALPPNVTLGTSSNWEASLQYATTPLQPDDEVDGNLTVQVPSDAKQGDEAIFFLESGDQLEFHVIVGAFYGVEMQTPGSVSKQTAGDTYTTTIHLTNTGNAVDSIRLHVGGLPQDWNVTFDGNALLGIPAGGSVALPLEIEISKAAASANYKATLQASSISDSRFFASSSLVFPVEALEVEDDPVVEETPAPFLIMLLGLVLLARRRFG